MGAIRRPEANYRKAIQTHRNSEMLLEGAKSKPSYCSKVANLAIRLLQLARDREGETAPEAWCLYQPDGVRIGGYQAVALFRFPGHLARQ